MKPAICKAGMFGALLAAAASAQYFGQNKVRFKEMDFEVLVTEHFKIYYYPEEKEAVTLAGRMAERWYTRLSEIFDHDLPAGQPVVFYDSHPAFRQTTVIPGEIGVGTGGVTEGLKRRVVMPMAGPLAETDHVLGHELVHAFQYDMTAGPRSVLTGGATGAAVLPLWFIEGMAEYLSLGSVSPNTAMWLRDAVRRNKLPDLKKLNDPEYFPYRFGHAFWSYVGGVYGDAKVGKMLLAAGKGGNVGGAIKSVLGINPDALIEQWHTALVDAYQPVLEATRPVAEQASAVIKASEGENSLNVSPSLSPDGKKMVMFSARGLFSIELYLVNAETGEIERRLTESASDPHLDSMEFIQSAGSWSRDGNRFAFSTIHTGWPVLSIYDFQRGEVVKEHQFELGEIFTPTWSPAGDRIAFSANSGGLIDLFVVDVESGRLERLTNDPFADMQPAWSPDGRHLAFVTDRFGASLDNLSFGRYRLGLFDTQSRQITELPAFPTGKQINPQWGDSNQLYFVSDRDGVANIYRMDMGSRNMTQLTGLQTGVAGIAPLSPAMSVSSNGQRIAFSAFREGMYGIYSIEPGKLGNVPATGLAYTQVASLPPEGQASRMVGALLRRPRTGLVPASSFQSRDYHPSLSLDYIAPPTIAAGVSSYGSLIGGGTALYFSDLLSRHQVMTSFQTVSTRASHVLRNLSAIGGYQNRQNRWTWGVIGGQSPYLSGGYQQSVTTVEGTPVVIEDATTFWQIERIAMGTLSYPFSRAQRIEFTGGYRNIGFAAERERSAYLLATGEFVGSDTTDLDAPPGINLGTGSAALVYDTSLFGGTSPVGGRRYRFEIGGNTGNLTYTTALADFRQYLRLPYNLSLAGRVLHYGRYGGSAEDGRLQDLFLGYPSLIRGYTGGSFSATECGPQLAENGECPAFDQLLGSRIAVGNAELRIPILGALGVVPSRGFPPVELAPFFDAGIAWRNNERLASVVENGRDLVKSYGLSLRTNVLGFAVFQFSYVKPMDRPRGWHFDFSLLAGF